MASRKLSNIIIYTPVLINLYNIASMTTFSVKGLKEDICVSAKSDGGCTGCVGGGGPVDPVIVMKVHENGYRLSQYYARPHYHIPYLPSGEGKSCQ